MRFFEKKSIESVKKSLNNSGLSKNLTAIDLIFIGLGATVGAGVFILTGFIAAHYSGPATIISYSIAGITCIFVALCYAEIASMVPTSGSVYSYSYIAFGEGIALLVCGILILNLVTASAAIASGWSAYMIGLLNAANITIPSTITKVPDIGGIIDLPAMLIIGLLYIVLFFGTTVGKKVNTILVLIKFIIIVVFIILAIPKIDPVNWQTFIPFGWSKVFNGASILFFAFDGFSILVATAEECKNPKKDLTPAIIISILLSTILYIILAAILTAIVPYNQLNTPEPMSYAMRYIGNKWAASIIAVGVISGMITAIMACLYTISRVMYVASRDQLLPSIFSDLHTKYKTPKFSLLFACISAIILAGFCPYQILGQISSIACILEYIIVISIVILFRRIYPKIGRPFSCPIVYIISPTALIACSYLLYLQTFQDGGLTLEGKIALYWIFLVLLCYLINQFCVKKIFYKKQ